MKKYFTKKNLYTFFLLYFVLTIGVSIYNLVSGNNYDYLGFWHEIYRVFFVLFVLLTLDIIRSFSFKRGLKGILDKLWPLLLCLLSFVLLLYLKGDLDTDILKKILLYVLGLIIGIILFRWIYTTLKVWFRNIFAPNKKKYFSFSSLILISLLLVPAIIYMLANKIGFNSVISNRWYLMSMIVFALLSFGLLLSANNDDPIPVLTIIQVLLCYISWFILGYGSAGITSVFIVQVLASISLLSYENYNKFNHCVPVTILLFILMSIAVYVQYH